MATRWESDSLGRVELPADALFGAHAARARDNFALTGQGAAPALVTAFAQVKVACARTNAALGYLAPDVADAVVRAARELAAGQWREAMVVDALAGGAGTSLNMNVNEVLANRAEELLGGRRGEYRLVHPLDHVNLHQSTNDTYPTALKVATIGLLRQLHIDISELQMAFQRKEGEFAHVVKIGRMELNAFLPLVAHALLGSLSLLCRANRMFRQRCVEGIEVDEAACRAHVEASLSTVTALVPLVGYETAAQLARQALAENRSIAELVRERQLLSDEALALALSPAAMTALGYRGKPREAN